MMTEEEKKKLLARFQKPEENEDQADDWTEEEVFETFEKLIERMRRDEKL